MKRLLAFFFLLLPTLALAGSSTVNYTSSGSSPFRTTTDGSSNNLANQTIWDSVSGANGWAITTNNAGKVEGVGAAGTATGGILTVQGVASMTPFLVSQSGTWSVGQVGTWTVTGAGGLFPATQSGVWTVQPGNTANTTPWLVTGAGQTFPSTQSGTWTVQPGNTANTVAWLVTGTGGVFPATQSGAWNITNITGSIALPTGAATSANQPSVITSGSASSSQTGTLTFGAVTTNVPTYTTGQSNPISLDTSGGLRVDCIAGCGGSGSGGGTSSLYGAAFPSAGTAIGYTDGTNMQPGRVLSVGADATSNNVDQIVDAAMTYMYNGTTWDRIRGDTTNGLWVNIKNGAVSATQSGTWTVNVSNVNPNGQNTMANSSPVVIASNQSTLNVACTSGCVGGNANGQATMANSAPVVIASNQSAIPVTIPVGQTTMSASTPVAIANDQRVSTANSSVAINVSTATTTQLVALSGTTKIYVTSYDVIAGGTGNITFEYGTGTNCGTGTTALTGAYNLVAQAGISKGSGIAPVLVVPSGNALCVLTSAAVQMSGSASFQQF